MKKTIRDIEIKPINRRNAKAYIDSCPICKEQYNKHKPLFSVNFQESFIYNDSECYSKQYHHIFYLEELNKWLNGLIESLKDK